MSEKNKQDTTTRPREASLPFREGTGVGSASLPFREGTGVGSVPLPTREGTGEGPVGLPFLVALTGGIGCGKTTVLNCFRELGIPCFVADEVAGGYYRDAAFLSQIRDLFGGGVFLGDGSIDKRALAEVVFHDADALARLNGLVHPRVWEDFLLFAACHRDAPYVIFESAITYEYGFDRKVDRVVCVYLELEERLRRLAERDHATREQLLARIANQLPAEEKLHRADYVILNYEGNPRPRQVHHIHQELLKAVR